MLLTAQFPEWGRCLFQTARYKVIYGGRGGGRSWNFARALLIRGMQTKLRILCAREYQKSIADSVHRLLTDQISLLNLPGWEVTQRSITHRGTGTVFIFEGLRYNTNRIKSLEGIDICWVEEAESVAKDSWEILIPTIRKEGSEIWISFNPNLESDPTYQRFVVNQPHNAIVMKIGWEDNPWFPETLREEKDYLYSVDPEAADYVWGGNPRKHSEAQVLRDKWIVEAFEPHPDWAGPFYGGDFGFAEDPTTLIQLFVEPNPRVRNSQGTLYIRKESWKIRLEIDQMSQFWQKTMGNRLPLHVIRGDSARPETISFLKRHGLPRISSVYKWPGSVEDGIAYLRGFEKIVIHPECKHTIEEARLWSYKVDKDTQEVLPVLIDKHNHCWDGVRYALQPMIRAKRLPKSSYSGMAYGN